MPPIALYAGSFDPPTYGHLHIIKTGLELCHRLVLAIGIHPTKKTLFSFEERVQLFKSLIEREFAQQAENIDIVAMQGLLVDKARAIGAKIILRGVRDSHDFNDEMKLSGMNKALAPEIDTIFIPAGAQTRHLTATLVRQIASMGGDVSPFVPDVVRIALKDKFDKKKDIS